MKQRGGSAPPIYFIIKLRESVMDDIQKLKNHVAALERELNALWALHGNAAAPECRFRRPECYRTTE